MPMTPTPTASSVALGEINRRGVLLNDALALDDPNTGNGFGTTIDTPFTASITDLPEPDAVLLLGVAIAALPLLRRGHRTGRRPGRPA